MNYSITHDGGWTVLTSEDGLRRARYDDKGNLQCFSRYSLTQRWHQRLPWSYRTPGEAHDAGYAWLHRLPLMVQRPAVMPQWRESWMGAA